MAHRKNSLVIRTRVEDRTNLQKDMFIRTLENVHTVSVAIKIVGLSKDTVYRWRRQDEDFAKRWDNAIEFSAEMLETAIYHKVAGELSNKGMRLSMPVERATEFLLSGMKPDKYKLGNRIDIDVNQLNITIDWSTIPDDMLADYNQGKLTIQDVYEYTVQSKAKTGSDTSETRRTE